jgi:SIR2-like domain
MNHLREGDEMSTNAKFDIIREIEELKSQLALSRKIGFFLGAGTSISLGIPGISELTKLVSESLGKSEKNKYEKLKETLDSSSGKNVPNIEDILNQVRLIRQLTHDSKEKAFEGITGVEAKTIDSLICLKIYELISAKEKDANLQDVEKLMVWFNWLNREYTKEIFTANYDLIFERALENLQIPYFDGFVGGNEPFFLAETVEPENKLIFPPVAWIRLWKIHGSLGWFWKEGKQGLSHRVVRMGSMTKPSKGLGELVIYPSKDKYESSRKQPFIAFFDRLKNYLLEGECHFILNGYSFSDDHVNAILFNGLKENNRLHMSAFLYDDERLLHLSSLASPFPNLSVYAPTKASIGGVIGEWQVNTSTHDLNLFWDDTNKKCKLGNFKDLVSFLVASSGRVEKIDKEIKERHAD